MTKVSGVIWKTVYFLLSDYIVKVKTLLIYDGDSQPELKFVTLIISLRIFTLTFFRGKRIK